MRDGGAHLWAAALIASTRKSRIDRPCARRLSHTVSIRSTKSDPVRLADPKEFFRQSTAFRSARSARQCRVPDYAASGTHTDGAARRSLIRIDGDEMRRPAPTRTK